jgi:hypothetical protein
MTAMRGRDAPVPRGWRLLLSAVAAVQFLGGLRDLSLLFANLSEVPGPGLGGAIIIANIILQPIFGLIALVCAASGRIGAALLAMAAIILMTWLNWLPSVARHGLDFKGTLFVSLQLIFQIVIAPLLAVTVATLAVRSSRTALAIGLAVLPTLVSLLGVVAFGIGVARYGF